MSFGMEPLADDDEDTSSALSSPHHQTQVLQIIESVDEVEIRRIPPAEGGAPISLNCG